MVFWGHDDFSSPSRWLNGWEAQAQGAPTTQYCSVKTWHFLFTEITSTKNQMMHVTSIFEHTKILLCQMGSWLWKWQNRHTLPCLLLLFFFNHSPRPLKRCLTSSTWSIYIQQGPVHHNMERPSHLCPSSHPQPPPQVCSSRFDSQRCILRVGPSSKFHLLNSTSIK